MSDRSFEGFRFGTTTLAMALAFVVIIQLAPQHGLLSLVFIVPIFGVAFAIQALVNRRRAGHEHDTFWICLEPTRARKVRQEDKGAN